MDRQTGPNQLGGGGGGGVALIMNPNLKKKENCFFRPGGKGGGIQI